MPIVTIKVLDGVFSRDDQESMIDAVTDAMCSVGGEGMRPAVQVLVEEVPDGRWGIGGGKLRAADILDQRAKRTSE